MPIIEATTPKMILSVYRYLRLNPPLATKKTKSDVDIRNVDRTITNCSMIAPYKSFKEIQCLKCHRPFASENNILVIVQNGLGSSLSRTASIKPSPWSDFQ